MPVVTSISVKRKGIEAVGKADMKKALRLSMGVIGNANHRILKRRKFLRNAAKRYNHTPRNRDYIFGKIFKRKMFGARSIGEATNFVFTGTTRQNVMAGKKIDARAFSSAKGHVDVIYNTRVFNFSGDGNSKTNINLREEFERTHPEEDRLMFKLGKRRYDRYLTKINKTKTKTNKV